ncbi:MAG: hypothetical protein WAK93_00080, partial [Solirubrobacteraceae bacterium]
PGARAVPALVATAALALVACGGGATSKKDVIARANAICADAVRDIRATPAPAGGQISLPALATYLRQVLPTVKKEVASLRALPRPTQNRALLNSYLAAVAASGSDYEALAKAAARGDRAGVSQALEALQTNPDESLARRYGLAQCAGSTGTSVS